MSKDAFDRAADAVKKTVDDVKDRVHEGGHRAAADAEKGRREAMGDAMTPGEKAGSALNEVKHRAEAEFDAAKRKVRENT